MTEWTVVGVIIAILGLLGTVCAPVLKLNTSITKLNLLLDMLEKRFEEEQKENKQAHSRLWERTDKNTAKLADHETRIHFLENPSGKGE